MGNYDIVFLEPFIINIIQPATEIKSNQEFGERASVLLRRGQFKMIVLLIGHDNLDEQEYFSQKFATSALSFSDQTELSFLYTANAELISVIQKNYLSSTQTLSGLDLVYIQMRSKYIPKVQVEFANITTTTSTAMSSIIQQMVSTQLLKINNNILNIVKIRSRSLLVFINSSSTSNLYSVY